MGGAVTKDGSPRAKTKLEAKIIEAILKREVKGSSIKSFNSIILKFPKIDESFRKCKTAFQEFDEDGNGVIDPQELKHCFCKLELSFTDEEINDLFEACDINEDMRMKFNEFIVLLCLVYLLKEDQTDHNSVSNVFRHNHKKVPLKFDLITKKEKLTQKDIIRGIFKSQIGMPTLRATFETVVDTFVFLDKNNDGYVSKEEMIQAINETTSGERSSGRIAMKRFEEMDWDKNGMVNFKEFLFAFTHWVGIEDIDDEDEDDNEGPKNV
ncbi:putative calcium-binding protein cml21 [Castilleja foliolosa]|uniref:Calcium-binding protein cml21 n=1 Tax=Castilleja foliolosa TaxID=1961234 RepID=A0ABD3D660_9LAMI